MAQNSYTLNRGVNAPVVFKGLQGQYIFYLGGGLAALLVLFVTGYIAGVNPWICLGFVLGGGGYLFAAVYRFSKKYGVHGVMKRSARRQLPRTIRNDSRTIFFKKCGDGQVAGRTYSGSRRGA
jgi:hypothetical protein